MALAKSMMGAGNKKKQVATFNDLYASKATDDGARGESFSSFSTPSSSSPSFSSHSGLHRPSAIDFSNVYNDTWSEKNKAMATSATEGAIDSEKMRGIGVVEVANPLRRGVLSKNMSEKVGTSQKDPSA